MTNWDERTDLLVVGSGAAGMTAALTAKLEGLESIVLEKCEYYGGSSAISGGGIWVPNNHLMAEAGVEDSIENARLYMNNTVGARTPRANQEAFLTRAPEMLQYLSRLPHMQFRIMRGFSDYYPERPGGMDEGRGIDTPIFRGRRLGKLFHQLRPHPIKTPFDLVFSTVEIKKIFLLAAHPPYLVDAFKVLARNLYNKVFGVRHAGSGAALIARLRISLREQGVPVWLNTPVKEIVFDNGSAIGVEVEKEGKRLRIRATKGVVLAAGGFPHNQAMREKYQKHPVNTRWTVASPGNTGEVIEMGINAGAAVDLMDDNWGMPTVLPPDKSTFPLVMERSYPGAIMVNAAGRRFTNEAAPYLDVVHAMYEEDSEGCVSIPSFWIMDKRFHNRYFLAGHIPGILPSKHLEAGYIIKADTIAELAEKTGIDPLALVDTVEGFNDFARRSKDLDFKRGDSAYDRFYSDPSVKPNPCLAPIEKPPFLAVKVFPGDIGTKGGLLTNENAQVLDKNGAIIEGLYAAGNTSASVMGNTYPGPGSTLGPAMTFGYIGAMHAAGRSKSGGTTTSGL